MALTADFHYATMQPTIIIPMKSNVADTYYKGAMVNVNSGGYIKVAADVAGEIPAGVVAENTVVASGETKDIPIERGIVRIAYSGAAITDVGDFFYATADDTLVSSATNVTPFGKCVAFETGYLWIDTTWKADS